jgi:hypothetical protein
MNLQSVQSSYAEQAALALAGVAGEFSIEDVVVRHLKTPAEIAGVLHLREEIDLSVHAASGPQFEVLEKKEMSWVSSSGSTCMAS